MFDISIKRRALIKGAALVSLAAASAGRSSPNAAQQPVPYSSGTESPRSKAPPHACDCHMHFYDSRFPVAPTATLRPPAATPDDYRLFQKRIGTTRTVVVQPSTYGTDNRCTLAGVQALGTSAVAVAVVDTSVTDKQLQDLADQRVRGIRFNLVQAGATTVEMLKPLAQRVHSLGWHIQLHVMPEQIVAMADLLESLPTPLVFDHMGRLQPPGQLQHPAYKVVQKLLDRGNTWIKLSGAYMNTKAGPPTYADVAELGRAYVKAAPERMLWASDWPHPTQKEIKPNDAVLFDLLTDWASEERTRQRILVDNPQALYRFATAS
jgi:predicted TIM-barrel fold metal-dependent hydrolase